MKTSIKLFTPGPVQVPPAIREATAKPIIYHRDPDFLKIFHELITGLKYLFQTQHDVLIFTASGTGGMEAAIVNLFSPGDPVLVFEHGKFSNRWAEIGELFGLDVKKIKLPWGESISPGRLKKALLANQKLKAVLLTHCETSTGALNDLNTLATMIHENSSALVVVDAISTIGVLPFKMDAWKIDVAITSSNKGLKNPPGVVFIALNARAKKYIARAKLPRYYFDFQKALEALNSNIGTPFTPAISLFYGIQESLRKIRDQGLEEIWAHHHTLAAAFRAALSSLGLEILPQNPADSLTVVKISPPLKVIPILTALKNEFGIVISNGQGKIKNRVIRIGHVGEIKANDLEEIIAALETILINKGLNLKKGRGINIFYDNLKR